MEKMYILVVFVNLEDICGKGNATAKYMLYDVLILLV